MMKYLLSYKLYEASGGVNHLKDRTREEKIGALLHLYGSIPVSKEKAAVVISKIVYSNKGGEYFKLSDKYIIPGANKLHDQLRFADYFDSLLTSKDTRGHNFEGLIAGLFGGSLTKRGSRSDVTIDDTEWSVKFVNNKSESPVLGSIKASLDRQQKMVDKFNKGKRTGKKVSLLQRIGSRGVVDVFKSNDESLKDEVFKLAFRGTNGFIIGYPDRNSNGDDIIILNILSTEQMKEIVCNGGVVNPKNSTDMWSLRIASSYRRKTINQIEIDVPIITNEELDELIATKDTEWAKDVFGWDIARRMRPDVVQDIRKNKAKILHNLDINS